MTHAGEHPDDLDGPQPDRDAPEAVPGGIEQAIAREPSWLRRCAMILGPGLTSGASNNDPSAIATYVLAGAGLGFAVLWTVPLLLPMMAAVVFLCAKLGMVGGRGLAGLLREHYPHWLLHPLVIALLLANTFNAAADLGAIAAGLNLLVPIRAGILLPLVAAALLAVQVWGSYRFIAGLLKWLTLALFGFIVAGVLARPDWPQVIHHTLIPELRTDRRYLSTLVAMIGTTLSPYLYFWQSSQQVEEEICMGRRKLWQRRGATDGELAYASWDVNTGMVVAAAIIYFIILCAGATLFRAGQHEVASAADAARALEPLAGPAAGALFAIGFIGSGLLAVPVLTAGASYALAEAHGWPRGLDRRPAAAPRFYATILLVTAAAVGINYLGLNPLSALFVAALVNGLLAPPVLLMVLLASNNRRIIGRHVNGRAVNVLGWMTLSATLTATVMLLLNWGNE